MDRSRVSIAFAVVALAAGATHAIAANGGSTSRVSVGDGDEQANCDSFALDVSATGRFAAFSSCATNLGAGDHPEVFVRDRRTRTTRLVSDDPADVRPHGGSISSGGRVIAYTGTRADGCLRVYVRDGRGGGARELPVGRRDAPGNEIFVWAPALSPDGRYVAFMTHRDLEGLACNGLFEREGNVSWYRPRLMLFDRRTGKVRRVRVPGVVTRRSEVAQLTLSRGARVIVLGKQIGDREQNPGVHVFDRRRRRVSLADVTTSERRPRRRDATEIDVSANGRFVAFQSRAHFVGGDSGSDPDIFVRDRKRGRTTRVSVGSDEQGIGHARFPSLSANGRFVAFESTKPEDILGAGANVYVRDRRRGRTIVASVDSSGRPVGRSGVPELSDDGKTVVFTSPAANLVPGDTDGFDDAFARRLRWR